MGFNRKPKYVKTDAEIAKMREAGRMLSELKAFLRKSTQAGMTEMDLERLAQREIKKLGGTPTFQGFMGYPYALCISNNNVVNHGQPKDKIIKKGDLLGIDTGVTYKGWHSDSAFTFCVDDVAKGDKKRILEGTKQAMDKGIEQVKAGARIGNIEAAIGDTCRKFDLGIVTDLCGHGIGRTPHEPPQICNDGIAGSGETLKAGMTICIEPITTLGSGMIIFNDHHSWDILSADDTLSAHFEEMVLVTDDGFEILT